MSRITPFLRWYHSKRNWLKTMYDGTYQQSRLYEAYQAGVRHGRRLRDSRA